MRAISLLTLFLLLSSLACADTFVNKRTNKTFTGFATTKKLGDKTIVISREAGKLSIIPSYYNISYDAKGRKNAFATIKITNTPKYNTEAEAIEKAIKTATDRGYLFVLIELDADGGEPYIEIKLSSAITNNWQCPIYCYINGNGAHDYAALIPLACNKIFISKDATFGSNVSSKSKLNNPKVRIKDLHKTIGNNVGEKFTSILRATASSLAQNNDRPTILAQAMFDNQLKAIEVENKGGNDFISDNDKRKTHKIIKTVSEDGEFLELDAKEALETAMADKIVDSKEELLSYLEASDAEEVVFDKHVQVRNSIDSVVSDALETFEKIQALENKLKTLSNNREKVATIQALLRCYNKISKVAIRYPELGVSPTETQLTITYYKSLLRSLKDSNHQ